MLAAASLRTACFASLRTAAPRAMRMPPHAPRAMNAVRSFQTSRLAPAPKTYYTVEHEWLRYDDETNEGVLGITDHAQNSLGDVVYLELPSIDLEVSRGDQIGAIESVKAASDIYSPVSGVVIDVNKQLDDEMTLVNKSPMDEGMYAHSHTTNALQAGSPRCV